MSLGVDSLILPYSRIYPVVEKYNNPGQKLVQHMSCFQPIHLSVPGLKPTFKGF